MASIYIAVRLITAPGEPEQVLEVLEFTDTAWEIALQSAYDWLLAHRKTNCVYNVYC